jgi:hypothetical protein
VPPSPRSPGLLVGGGVGGCGVWLLNSGREHLPPRDRPGPLLGGSWGFVVVVVQRRAIDREHWHMRTGWFVCVLVFCCGHGDAKMEAAFVVFVECLCDKLQRAHGGCLGIKSR